MRLQQQVIRNISPNVKNQLQSHTKNGNDYSPVHTARSAVGGKDYRRKKSFERETTPN